MGDSKGQDFQDKTSDYDSDNTEQPDWLQLIAPVDNNADITDEFHFNDGGPD